MRFINSVDSVLFLRTNSLFLRVNFLFDRYKIAHHIRAIVTVIATKTLGLKIFVRIAIIS